MRILIRTIIVIALAIPVIGIAQDVSSEPPPNQQGIMAASSSLKILSPPVGQKIGATTVDVRYQLTDSGATAAPSPTYRVQLDGRDPSETLDTEYNFTGL